MRKRGTFVVGAVNDRALLKFLKESVLTESLHRAQTENRDKMTSPEPIIRSKQTEKEVNGISTQVVCTEFSNYIFIVLTQYGKIGTLVSVTPDSRSNDISTSTFSTKVLLGKEEPLTHVCAKNLATFVSQEAGNRPVLLGLALKDSSLDAINQMKEVIRSCKVW
ncbi:proteasome assembly chaperone 3 [Halichoeres trimaculatus]|uniref:proteasome assembly chaperone 3 n=1 Tax=Halichoeres trimaculatus TaxID=147232 RepID=UPI003D9F14EB